MEASESIEKAPEACQRVHQRQGEGWGRVEILRFFEVGVFVFRRVGGVEATMSELTASKNSVGKASNSQNRLLWIWRVSRLVGTRGAESGKWVALACLVVGARVRERGVTCDRAGPTEH